jgi:hypothetical protein
LLARLAGHDIVIVAGAEATQLGFSDLSAAVEATTTRAIGRGGSADGGSTADNGAMSLTPEVAG